MASKGGRTRNCTASQARTRLRQAEAMLEVAELVDQDPDDLALPSVATALAILAGIAASDAACCAALRQQARGQSHSEATRLLQGVNPHGERMAKDLSRLIAAKDESHYGLALVTPKRAGELIKAARRLTDKAAGIVTQYP